MMYGRFLNFHISVKQEQELRRIGYRFARESLVSGSETKTIKVVLELMRVDSLFTSGVQP